MKQLRLRVMSWCNLSKLHQNHMRLLFLHTKRRFSKKIICHMIEMLLDNPLGCIKIRVVQVTPKFFSSNICIRIDFEFNNL